MWLCVCWLPPALESLQGAEWGDSEHLNLPELWPGMCVCWWTCLKHAGEAMSHICGPLMKISRLNDNLIDYFGLSAGGWS